MLVVTFAILETYIFWFAGICSPSTFYKVKTGVSDVSVHEAANAWEQSNSRYDLCNIPQKCVVSGKMKENPTPLEMK